MHATDVIFQLFNFFVLHSSLFFDVVEFPLKVVKIIEASGQLFLQVSLTLFQTHDILFVVLFKFIHFSLLFFDDIFKFNFLFGHSFFEFSFVHLGSSSQFKEFFCERFDADIFFQKLFGQPSNLFLLELIVFFAILKNANGP